jgi:hypothetical protein
MAMFDCEACGQPGASYCPLVTDQGDPIEGYYHPTCYSKEPVQEDTILRGTASWGLSNITKARCSGLFRTKPTRGFVYLAVPKCKAGPMRKLRLPVGYKSKPNPFPLYRL